MRWRDDGIPIIIAIIVIVAIYAVIGLVGKSDATIPRMEPLTATFTADGGEIKAYVLIDPDTGVQYIVTDAGGIAPRAK